MRAPKPPWTDGARSLHGARPRPATSETSTTDAWCMPGRQHLSSRVRRTPAPRHSFEPGSDDSRSTPSQLQESADEVAGPQAGPRPCLGTSTVRYTPRPWCFASPPLTGRLRRVDAQGHPRCQGRPVPGRLRRRADAGAAGGRQGGRRRRGVRRPRIPEGRYGARRALARDHRGHPGRHHRLGEPREQPRALRRPDEQGRPALRQRHDRQEERARSWASPCSS